MVVVEPFITSMLSSIIWVKNQFQLAAELWLDLYFLFEFETAYSSAITTCSSVRFFFFYCLIWSCSMLSNNILYRSIEIDGKTFFLLDSTIISLHRHLFIIKNRHKMIFKRRRKWRKKHERNNNELLDAHNVIKIKR